jgi:hypothetical protein
MNSLRYEERRYLMETPNDLVEMIVKRFRKKGYSQVKGYNRFDYVSKSTNVVTVRRKCGTTARIPYSKIRQAIEAVHDDPDVYEKGPASLRKYNIKYITSPIWSLLHLLSLEELNRK